MYSEVPDSTSETHEVHKLKKGVCERGVRLYIDQSNTYIFIYC